jgi:fluoride ion exporter CrcB/FEX
MIAGLSAGFGFPSIVQLVHPAAPMGDLAFRLLGVLAIAVAVAVTRARGPVGRRVAVLVAAGLLPALAALLGGAPAAQLVTLLVILLVAVLVWPAAILSRRRQVGPASRAG